MALKFTNKSIYDRLGLLLDVLRLCVTLFEYGGKMQKSSQFPAAPRPKSAQQDMKAKLEEVLLGNKGAAREMMQRHSRVMLGNDWPFCGRARNRVGVVSNCTMGLFWETILTQFSSQLCNSRAFRNGDGVPKNVSLALFYTTAQLFVFIVESVSFKNTYCLLCSAYISHEDSLLSNPHLFLLCSIPLFAWP